MGVEWDVTDATPPEDGDAAAGTAEELAGGWRPPHLPRPALVLVVLAAVSGLIAAVVATRHARSTPTAGVPSGPVAPAPSAGTEASAVLVRVRQLALTPGPLPTYLRATTDGGCVLPGPGVRPQRRLAAAVAGAAPGYRVTDVAWVLEPTDALCSLQVRARDEAGDVVVVDVVAPATAPSDAPRGEISVGRHADGTTTIAYAAGVLRGGWRVTVGALGSAARLPGTAAVRTLLESPAARW